MTTAIFYDGGQYFDDEDHYVGDDDVLFERDGLHTCETAKLPCCS